MDSGEQIGKYKILTKIGEGGMGEVYLAHDLQLDRRIVLKFFSDAFSHDEELLQRFKQEARAASALNHPNIITIYEIGEHENRWFIATEYIEGKTLREILKGVSLTIGSAVKIAVQIAEALSAAHKTGIIHRDIKPENIMVREDGLVKVLDFGLAKLIEKKPAQVDKEAATSLQINTSVGLVLGTAAYMSPEQARGLPVDERTDIWSLGVVFYEMLTGVSPFSGETTSDIIAAILRTETAALPEFERDFPGELKSLLFKALEKDRKNRYNDVNELLTDLRSFQKTVEYDNKAELNFSSSGNLISQIDSENPTRILNSFTKSSGVKTTGKENSKNSTSRKTIFTGALLLLFLALAGIGIWFYKFQNPLASSQIESIAVIPFVNAGGDPETEYLSDGLAESLIDNLSKLPNLKVKAKSSVFSYKGKEFNAVQIGKELSAQAILTGRILQRGDNLSLSLELINSQNGDLLWGETYNQKAGDLINLQNNIVQAISNKLRTHLSERDEKNLRNDSISDSEAFRFYLKGRYYLNKRTPEDFEKAIQNFRAAIDRDPTYALAYAGLSDCYTEMTYWSVGLPKETMPKAKAAAKRALELDNGLAESHTSLAIVADDYDWNFAEAEQEYGRAIALNPSSAEAFRNYGRFLCKQKRFNEGQAKLEKAAELDPLSQGVEMSKGSCLYQERQYDKAIEQMQKILKSDPSYPPASSLLGAIYFRKGMYEKTVEEWLKNSPLENYSPEDIAAWKESFQTGGIKGFLQKDIELRKKAAQAGRNQTLFIAMQYANLGETEQALDWLDRAFEERHSWLSELDVEPTWDNLRDNPRFQSLKRRVGFTQ